MAKTIVQPELQMQISFDAKQSEENKEIGIERAANAKANRELLAKAKQIAVDVARREDREITADDVVAEMVRQGYGLRCLGNSAGALFRDKNVWEWTGEFRKSSRVHAHANPLRVWRLKTG